MNDLSNVSLWVDEVKKCKGGGQGMFPRVSPLPRIFVHSIKNQAKINMGLVEESTQNRRNNQNLRTPSRRVANPSRLWFYDIIIIIIIIMYCIWYSAVSINNVQRRLNMTTNYTGVIVIRKHLENSVVLRQSGNWKEWRRSEPRRAKHSR